MNPLLPSVMDIALSAALFAVFVLTIVALVSWVRTPLPSRGAAALWACAILLLPLLGAVSWFTSQTYRSRRATQT
ncbi:MAG: PLDc N-terminal domain-containing protein [Candidatus Microbacterium colombiense]|nr:MAG: PLDc N-terminal domain-containing protein [Microbacterium sp.]